MVEKYPFTEEKIGDNVFIRRFSENSYSDELQWHYDMEDRIIESIGDTDWEFQFDNNLPGKIDGTIFIPKGIWHRVIKGTGDLTIKLIKIKDEAS